MPSLSGSAPFSFSGFLHGGVLAWMIWSAPVEREPAQSMYDQVIRPHEHRLVWYHLKDRLPDISPSSAIGPARAPRASARSPQSIVSGAKDDARTPQRIWTPAPEAAIPKPPPLPNVLAVSQKPPLRAFIPPVPAAPRPNAIPAIPEAPATTLVTEPAALALDSANRRAPPKQFAPPVAAPKPEVAPRILDAPPAALTLPQQQAALSLDTASRRAPPRQWTPPAAPASAPASAEVPDAPDASSKADRLLDASLAIIGLNPAKAPEFTPPTHSREAGFSAGPEIQPDGDTKPNQPATLVVPRLLTSRGSKDGQSTLMAGVLPIPKREVMATTSAATEPEAPMLEAQAIRVSNAPDPRFQGRQVYSIAIQMPNITSYYGSWLVWFAERDRATATPGIVLRPPSPTRKVDPKYIPAAASERVEGIVRLFAVIRKNGAIDSIALIRHLDDRLDRSASEALAKWQFEPATRGGVPIDVDAIFEIPFRLAPRNAK